MLKDKYKKFKKYFNINNCAVNEQKELLEYFKYKALEDCSYELKFSVIRIYGLFFNGDNLSRNEPLKNNCLLLLASISSKLTRGSKDYSTGANSLINELLLNLSKYYYNVIEKEHEPGENIDMEDVYLTSSIDLYCLDNIITKGQYNTEEYVNNFTNIAKTILTRHILSLEVRGKYNTEKFDELLSKAGVIGDKYDTNIWNLFLLQDPSIQDCVTKNAYASIINEEKNIKRKR